MTPQVQARIARFNNTVSTTESTMLHKHPAVLTLIGIGPLPNESVAGVARHVPRLWR